MAGNEIAPFGAKLYIGTGAGSPENFTPIVALTSIGGISMTTAAVVTTSHDSPNAHHTKKPGIRDTGAIPFSGRWLPAAATHKNAGRGLAALAKNRTVVNFMIEVPTGSPHIEVGPFEGFISALNTGELAYDATEGVLVTGEITPTGEVDLPA